MRYLVTVFKDYGYPYLDRLLADVKLAGICPVPVLVKNDPASCDNMCSFECLVPLDESLMNEALSGAEREFSYILTDHPAGARLAGRYDIGYAYCEIGPGGKEFREDLKSLKGPQCIIEGFDEINADFIIKMYERSRHLPWTILSTERLILREMTVDDVDRLYEIYEGEGMTDHMEPLYEDRLAEIEYTRDYIRNMYELCGYGLWMVVEKDTKRVVGRAGITGRAGYEQAELGYLIEKNRQRRGYAAEACRAIIEYAGNVLKMTGLNCFISPGNEASVKLCKLLGFEFLEETELSGNKMLRFYLSLNDSDPHFGSDLV